MKNIRLQKFLSSAGVASRRNAEELIKNKKVTVNSEIAVLGDKIDPDKDIIKVRGEMIKPAEAKIYLILNKPIGYTTTRSDRHAERTVYDLLPRNLKKVVWPVGRLDKTSCGLLILTNDGELTQELTHPKYQHEKEYLVRTSGELTEEKIKELEKGIKIDDKKTSPAKIKLINSSEAKIIITEGQKRQVRRMLGEVNCRVTFLQRIRENKLQLSSLPSGKYKIISKSDII